MNPGLRLPWWSLLEDRLQSDGRESRSMRPPLGAPSSQRSIAPRVVPELVIIGAEKRSNDEKGDEERFHEVFSGFEASVSDALTQSRKDIWKISFASNQRRCLLAP